MAKKTLRVCDGVAAVLQSSRPAGQLINLCQVQDVQAETLHDHAGKSRRQSPRRKRSQDITGGKLRAGMKLYLSLLFSKSKTKWNPIFGIEGPSRF